MALGDLTEAQLGALTDRVRDRILDASSGMRTPPAATAMEIAASAVVFLVDVAPRAPEAIGRESAIRLAGWLLDNRPHVSEHEISDPSGTTVKLRFNNTAATANGWRASGASALVARYIRRRGGVIG